MDIKPGARRSASKMRTISNFVNRCRRRAIKRYRALILIFGSIMTFRLALRWRVQVWYGDRLIAPSGSSFVFFPFSIAVQSMMNEPYVIDTSYIRFAIHVIKLETDLFCYVIRSSKKKKFSHCDDT